MFRWITSQAGPYAIRQYLNSRYRRFGQMTQLRIDNARKTIEMELMLEGEREPITIQIPEYAFQADGPTPTLTIPEATVSRAWLNQLVAELLVGKPLPIPPHVAKLLRLVL